MHSEEFEKLVAEGYEKLPAWVRAKIKNVALLVAEKPTREQLEENGLEPETETLLGLYHGVPLSARGDTYGVGATLPDAITLFQKPIEEAAADILRSYELRNIEKTALQEKVREIIADTVWHEFAHHFGIDEEDVRKREEERRVEDY